MNGEEREDFVRKFRMGVRVRRRGHFVTNMTNGT